MQMCRFLRHPDIFINAEQENQGRKSPELSSIKYIFVYPFSVSIFFPMATVSLSLAAQRLRKFTANVLAIRNVIVLQGFRTVTGAHIKVTRTRTARMISPFSAEMAVKYTKKNVADCVLHASAALANNELNSELTEINVHFFFLLWTTESLTRTTSVIKVMMSLAGTGSANQTYH